ncbi:DNA mismatch repair protein Msh6 [Ceraceosorus guamensis]|uniref:DNA mismatch repair protein Msh6 n=1 Tax=Ceraceosorus guamensis TaxID=1522189 RepID=A0A316VV93_9BASI|nr:DNA mismatch repair protein Msh6 [Ceraceosorus guamensis]PWN40848.1 DNA mismatch repair protein Msh6 [Ceraceosorus guamensis]
MESEDEPVPRKRNNTNASSSKSAAASSSKGPGVQAGAMQAFQMGSSGSASPANGRPGGMQKSSSMSHLTKAERRVLDERKKKAENEQAYSFLRDLRDKDGNRPGDAGYDPRTLFIPNGAWKDFTPFEKQFWEIKQKHWDTVLFFQKGKFYELYEEDALIGHREFDLKLTDRVKMKMVGVPEGSFEQFANKFLALGYKVGRVDQCETAVAKGMRVGEKSRGGGSEIVRRELRHVLTGGTIVDSACLPDDMGSYCVAIKETEAVPGQPIFGVCVLDAATAEFRLSEFEDDVSRTKLETMLRSLRLRELLHEKAGLSQRTLRILRNTLPSSCQVTMLKSGTEFLDHDAAMERLEQLFGSSADSHEAWPEAITSMLDRDTAMSALGGMLWYLEQLNLDQDLCSSKNFDIFDPLKNNGCLVLDAQSLSHLNVLSNEQGNDVGTLHKLLNRCVTPFGKRLFKIWLVAPLCERRALEARHDAVDDFLSSPDFQDVFDKAAKKLPDIERIMPRIHAGKCKPMDFTRVLTALSELDGLIERLLQETQHFSSTTIGSLLRGIPQVSPIAQRLQDMFALKDDGAFIPRTGVFQDFDDAQDAESAILDQLERELARAAKTVKLERRAVKWKHVGTNEIFQVEVPAKTAVPKEWSIVSQTKDSKRWYPPAVRQLVQELKESRETLLASLKLFHAQLFEAFSEDTAVFTAAVKGIAELDCLLSLSKASYALGSPACRPQFIDCETASVDFKDLRHPCMSTNTGLDFISNDVALGDRYEEVVILTGGNMAGKSTTARTAATAVILAQLGCRVPASSAVISPVDRIASRMGANDQIFRNNSTFMVEMLEASRIIRECTPRSLVIMDELGRGTSTFDGHAIAFAVLHHLVGRTRCLSFFLTHYTSLAHDFDAYPGVANKHMQVVVDDENREVVFTYRLVPGIAESSYGTQVAALAGVPHTICDRAMQVSKEFSEASKALQAQRTHSRISVATLADFAHLVKRVSSDDTEDLSRQLGIIKAQARSLSLATASSSDLPKP